MAGSQVSPMKPFGKSANSNTDDEIGSASMFTAAFPACA
jgi:hypothetical protein